MKTRKLIYLQIIEIKFAKEETVEDASLTDLQFLNSSTNDISKLPRISSNLHPGLSSQSYKQTRYQPKCVTRVRYTHSTTLQREQIFEDSFKYYYYIGSIYIYIRSKYRKTSRHVL